MSYFLMAYRRYADFKGRSSRSEYWYFLLFYLIIFIILYSCVGKTAVDILLLGKSLNEAFLGGIGFFIVLILLIIFVLVSLIPSISITIRRLHDVGRSGWLYLIIFIPLVGWIASLILGFIDSEEGDNEYGANPKRIG
ncbi:MAG: hypothetical protein RLZZ210_1592 [Pseudomonadota bacterium]